MGSIARRVMGDLAASASGVLILLLALVIFDERFREQLAVATGGGAPGAAEFASMGHQVTNLALVVSLVVVQFFRQQSVEHAHLMVFTGVAIILALFFMRL